MKATISDAISAPLNAMKSCSSGVEKPNSAAPSTMAKLAPLLTPRIPGSASGLRVSVCMSAPARPNAPPASNPASVRGKRASRTMVQSALWHTPVNASSTTAAGSGFAPMTRLKTAARLSNNNNPGTANARVTENEHDIVTSLIMIVIIVIYLIWLC
ncbi:Uncharacterised protein [Salmonella enterica subsp. enterica serovar Bovismorbificans]|uniref:Uncharacterized protein n=1 Tax=Salmonella enterica subsp. enterica serovar Bovismorbificans TaxID=58097 RepID=A0A655BLE1_SALET|nr:Uncharacterised protein [Salmonella enterica subsp. enterica serovar Bovismorbificans]